jgi:hypothetical protein
MSSGSSTERSPEQRDNPFAPPPEDAPEQPWQPRLPNGDSGGTGGAGEPGDSRPTPPPPPPPAWNGQWSGRQPGPQDGGLGGPRPEGPGGPGGPGPARFDPTDPAQRRARYALISGMWGLFFALLGWTSFSLLLGALALYWGVSALRMKPEQRADARAAAAAALSRAPVHDTDPRPAPPSGDLPLKPQRTAAVSGIVTGGVALVLVAASFTFHLVYQDYYAYTQDALTSSSRAACAKLLPEPLRDVIDGTR